MQVPKVCGPGVYAIRNVVNGKVYVGSTARSLMKRLKQHRTDLRGSAHGNKHLQSAWNKYGEGSFEFSVLEECAVELCLLQEQHWLDVTRAADRLFGYNSCPTAGNSLGVKLGPATAEKKAQVSKDSKKMWKDPAHRKAMSDRMKKLWASPEHRKKVATGHSRSLATGVPQSKMSAAQKERFSDLAERERHSSILTEAYKSQEIRDAVSAAVKASITAEVRAKVSAAAKKRFTSKEARLAHGAAVKAALASPEVRARMSAALKGKKRTEEQKARISAGRIAQISRDQKSK